MGSILKKGWVWRWSTECILMKFGWALQDRAFEDDDESDSEDDKPLAVRKA